jgi:hypothetical protein
VHINVVTENQGRVAAQSFDPLTGRAHRANQPPRAPARPDHAGRHLAEERDGRSTSLLPTTPQPLAAPTCSDESAASPNPILSRRRGQAGTATLPLSPYCTCVRVRRVGIWIRASPPSPLAMDPRSLAGPPGST